MQLKAAVPVDKSVLAGGYSTAFPGSDVFAASIEYAHLKPSFRGYTRVDDAAPGGARHERVQRPQQDRAGGHRQRPARRWTRSSPPTRSDRAPRRRTVRADRRRPVAGPRSHDRAAAADRSRASAAGRGCSWRPRSRARGPVGGPDPRHPGHQLHRLGPADAAALRRASTTSGTCWPTTGSGRRSATPPSTRSCRCPWAWPSRWPSRSGLDQAIRGIAWIRTMYFLPLVTSSVAVGLVWLWIYAPQGGLLNELLWQFGIPPQRWTSDPFWAMPAIIAMSVWQGLGVSIIIFLAGLQAIPGEYHDAASVDGAGRWARFRQHHPAAADAEHLLHGHPEPHRRACRCSTRCTSWPGPASRRRPPSPSSTSSTRRASASSGWARASAAAWILFADRGGPDHRLLPLPASLGALPVSTPRDRHAGRLATPPPPAPPRPGPACCAGSGSTRCSSWAA